MGRITPIPENTMRRKILRLLLISWIAVRSCFALSNDSITWPRPNLYIGSKHVPTGSTFGFAWMNNAIVEKLRYHADDNDQLKRWGFLRNNGDGFWQQQFEDPQNQLKITAEMQPVNVQDNSKITSGKNSGSWQLRIQGESLMKQKHSSKKSQRVSLFFYMTAPQEQGNSPIEFRGDKQTNGPGRVGTVGIQSKLDNSQPYGLFILNTSDLVRPTHGRTFYTRSVGKPTQKNSRKIRVPFAPELQGAHVYSNSVPEKEAWRLGDILSKSLDSGRMYTLRNIYKLEQMADESIHPSERRTHVEIHRASTHGLIPLLSNQEDEKATFGIIQVVLHPPFDVVVGFVAPEDSKPFLDDASFKPDLSISKIASWLAGGSPGSEYDVTTFNNASFTSRSKLYVNEYENLYDQLFESPLHKDWQQVGEHAVSQVIGTITKYRGRLLMDARSAEERGSEGEDYSSVLDAQGHPVREGIVTESDEYELITGMPARSFFPRGFLWDEGFHQLLVLRWDPALTRLVLTSWFDVMTSDGWIPREQTIGGEAQSRVPPHFRVQRSDIANPPTLLLPIEALIENLAKQLNAPDDFNQFRVLECGDFKNLQECRDHLKLDESTQNVDVEISALGETDESDQIAMDAWFHEVKATRKWLVKLYPKLVRWLRWFLETQAPSSEHPYHLRWAGSSPNHTFASGLDDFPRGIQPSDQDIHVDLVAWIAWGSKMIHQMSEALEEVETAQTFLHHYTFLKNVLNDLWDDETEWFCDYGQVSFSKDVGKEKQQFDKICHKGYVGLIPFALRLIEPFDSRLQSIIRPLADPDQLLSPYGIRSLSNQDSLYRQGEDYWRGKVWVNINYLVYKSILYYARTKSVLDQASTNKIATEIRERLVSNIVDQFHSSGFLWENYDPDSGSGTGTHPFTGWTGALLPLLMADMQ